MYIDLYLQLCILVLRMGSAILSRFDVIFLLLDIPDESHDRRLSEHVMANRAGRGRTSSAVVTRTNSELETSILLEHSDMPLSERLQVKNRPYSIRSSVISSSSSSIICIHTCVYLCQDPYRWNCRLHSSMFVKEVYQLRSSICPSFALSWSSADNSGVLPVTEVSGTLCWCHTHHHTTARIFN